MQQALIGFSVVMLSGLPASIASAETPLDKRLNLILSNPDRTPTIQTSPNDLVFLAYSGGLRNHGIPSYGSLIHAYASGRVTAQDLVRTAISANKLPPQVLMDAGYLNVVNVKLAELNRG